MKKRSRAHEAGSIEAGSSISKSIFFANRVDGAVVSSQIEPVGAPRSAQSSQIEPARAPGAARWSHSRPDRPRKGARGSQDRAIRGQIDPARAPGAQIEPVEACQGEPGRAASRPAARANARWTGRRAISLLIFLKNYDNMVI